MNAYIHSILLRSNRPLSIKEIIEKLSKAYYYIADYNEVFRCLHKYIDGVYDKIPCGKRRYVYGLK